MPSGYPKTPSSRPVKRCKAPDGRITWCSSTSSTSPREILRLAQGSGVKLFMVNSALTPDQMSLLGAQPEKYPDWLGSLVPNDEEGGYLMLKELIRQHGPVRPGRSSNCWRFPG